MMTWEEIPINFGFGFMMLEDLAPFSELVMICTTINGASAGCSGPLEGARSASSSSRHERPGAGSRNESRPTSMIHWKRDSCFNIPVLNFLLPTRTLIPELDLYLLF